MKLKELLETLEPSQHIKIGSQDGTSFFYVGNPKDFLRTLNTDSKFYGEYDKVIEKSMDAVVKNAQENLDGVLANAQNKVKEKFTFTERDFKKTMLYIFESDIAGNMTKCVRALEKAVTHRKQTKPLIERDVMEYFAADKVADEGTLAIVIEGFECGRFWTYDEGQKGGFGGAVKPSIKLSNVEA